MYSEKVMEHFEHPRNVGEIPDASGTGTVGNAKCGDIMKMDIKVETTSSPTSSSRPSAAARPSPPAAWPPRWSRASISTRRFS